MSTHIYVDETKAKGYLVAAATRVDEQLRLARKELGKLILPGQRGLHMKDEKDSRKREIADTIVGLGDLGVRATIYDAGRAQTERERRARCLQALLDDAAKYTPARIVIDLDQTLLSWDRQTMVELTRIGGLRERVTYTNATRHQELLLAIPGRHRLVLGQGRTLAAASASDRCRRARGLKCAKPERHGRPAGSRAHFLELSAPDT